MGQKMVPALAVVSLLVNAVLIAFLLAQRIAPPAFGAAGMAGDGFIMATEKSSDGTPVCFVINTQKPQLLAYRTSPQGQLQLTNARDLECDLKLRDNFFPDGDPTKKMKTKPPVKAVCDAVNERDREKEKVEAKKPASAEKKVDEKKAAEPKEEEGQAEEEGKK